MSSRAFASDAPRSQAVADLRNGYRALRSSLVLCPLLVALVILAFATLETKRAIVAALLSVALVVLAAADIERGIIPNRVVLPATGLVLTAQMAMFSDRALVWLLAPLAAGLALLTPALFGREWMGMGDVKLALLLGAGLGWGAIGAILLAFVCVFPVALLVLVRVGLSARKSTIPFAPFLALGALMVLFAPHFAGLGS
jgi:leader peptidase (prepilin peptidase) / N-methyltransferase